MVILIRNSVINTGLYVFYDYGICDFASFITAIAMRIAASILIVRMFSAFHFLRIIFLSFNLTLFIECFLVCCVAHHRTTVRAVIPASLAAGIAGYFRFLLHYWLRLIHIRAGFFRFWLVLVHTIASLDPLYPFRIVRVANSVNKFTT